MDDKSKQTQPADTSKPQLKLAPHQPNPAAAPAKKGLSKGALWGIIGGSIAAVLLIVGIVLAVVLLGGPTREDYKKAHEQMTTVRSAYVKVSSSFRSAFYGSSGASADSIKTSVDDYKKAVDGLKDMKALRDKDVKQKYDEFTTQNEKFTTAIDDLADASDEVLAVSRSCRISGLSGLTSDRSKVLERYDSTVSPCVNALKKLSKVKNETIAAEAKKMVEAYDEQRGIVEELQKAYNAGDRDATLAAASKLSKQAAKFRNTDSMKKLTEAFTQAEVTNQLNALGRILTDKANQS